MISVYPFFTSTFASPSALGKSTVPLKSMCVGPLRRHREVQMVKRIAGSPATNYFELEYDYLAFEIRRSTHSIF